MRVKAYLMAEGKAHLDLKYYSKERIAKENSMRKVNKMNIKY